MSGSNWQTAAMADDDAAEHTRPDSGDGDDGTNLKRRLILGAVALGSSLIAWFVGAAVLPRWWAQRIGDVIDGRLTLGSLLGIVFGVVFTVLALGVLALGVRFRNGWRRALLTVIGAAVVAAPNLMTLGIVLGDGNAAHAGERILDVDGPGFRGGSLVGAVLGALGMAAIAFLSSSRRRNKRKAKELKAELDNQ